MASLTEQNIRDEASDEVLLKRLFAELEASMPASLHDDLEDFVTQVEYLPPGLRAMAATYQLDVSMTLDDLGWHFANWHDRPYCEETSRGLHELETGELAELFDRAYSIAGHQWEVISTHLRESFDAFTNWYRTSELEATLMPLNRRWWEICNSENNGLFQYWTAYARKYPERTVFMDAAEPRVAGDA